MKIKLAIIPAALIFFLICGCTSSTSTEENKNSTSFEKGKPIKLDKALFLENVWNYEESTTWKHIGEKPAIIDFYADWCGPCKRIAPIIDEMAEKYQDDIVVYKINTDEQKELAAVFKIRSIPSIMFIPKNGQPQMTRGALPKQTIEKIVNELLLKEDQTENNNTEL